jgi:hypothetical protein
MENTIVLSAGYWMKSCVICSHGRQYGCPMRNNTGVWQFKFKGQWHNLEDYTVEGTLINDHDYGNL